MANNVYPLYKQSLLNGDTSEDLVQTTANVAPYCSLNTSAYNAAHKFYSDVVAGNIGTVQQITSPTVSATGTFDGGDLTYTAVSGAQVTALIFYRSNAGANSTWRLFLFLDTSVTNLPVTPNGGNITITWNASGIFTISDRTVKRDIEEIGSIGPMPLYSYRYAWASDRHVGVMAQDVAAWHPPAARQIEGRWIVDYAALMDRLAA